MQAGPEKNEDHPLQGKPSLVLQARGDRSLHLGLEGLFLPRKEVQQNLGTQGPQIHWNLPTYASILTFMVLFKELPNFNGRDLQGWDHNVSCETAIKMCRSLT